MRNKTFLFFIIIFLILTSVSAQLKLPSNVLKINEENKTYYSDFSLKITFMIAFLAGILGILSPCILPILPAYFSYTFKEKKNITFITLVFFLGFSTMFILLGLIAGFLGEQTLNLVQGKTLIRIAALFIFVFGVMSFFGKSFSLIKLNYKGGNDIIGVFIFGILFAISWTGCLGPVLSGILGMGAILGDYAKSGMMMFFYGLGNFVPLFLLSVFYDKLDMKKFMKGKEVRINLFSKEYRLNSINVISGLLLMGSAVFLLVFGDTRLFNGIDPFGTKLMFYDYQNKLLGWASANTFSIIVFVLFIIVIAFVLYNKKKLNNNKAR